MEAVSLAVSVVALIGSAVCAGLAAQCHRRTRRALEEAAYHRQRIDAARTRRRRAEGKDED